MNYLRTNTGLWAKEGGNVLFNDAFNTFIHGYMASGI